MADLEQLTHEDNCYLTTTGRRSGEPHTIEIWFALHDRTLFVLSGGGDGADWVRNLRAEPRAHLRIERWEGTVEADEPAEDDPVQPAARHALREKYAYEGDDLVSWARDALLVRLTPVA
jgi:deazaflavin-dependent oxidoreductase (nitroreductase family)